MKCALILIVTLLCFNKSYAQANDSAVNKKHDSLPYATLHFYRAYFPKYFSNVKKAPVYINDSLVHELKANTVAHFNINREGKIRVAVDKNQQTEIEFKVKFGKEYFFRVDVTGGILNKQTTIEAVTPAVGKEEIRILPKYADKQQ